MTDLHFTDQLALAHWAQEFPSFDGIDPQFSSADGQTAWLEQLLQADDLAHPADDTTTPPWGEPIPLDEYITDSEIDQNYEPLADTQAAGELNLDSAISDAFPPVYPAPHWENDDQYHGLGVPPGVENFDQPVEFGGTQAIPINPAADHGWDAWTGRRPARVARYFGNFYLYNAGTARRMGTPPPMKMETIGSIWDLTQQRRDLMLVALKQRGIHGVVVTDVPSVPYTDEAVQLDPSLLTPAPEIGPEGVLP